VHGGRVDDLADALFVAAGEEDEVVGLEGEGGGCPGEGGLHCWRGFHGGVGGDCGLGCALHGVRTVHELFALLGRLEGECGIMVESGKLKVDRGKWEVESGKWKVQSVKCKAESGDCIQAASGSSR